MASPSSSVAKAHLILDALWARGTPCPFDEVIDVRSPAEYADDHIPGSINLPVLGDAERATVGTIYRGEGAFAAAKVGAAFVSANIAVHLRTHFGGQSKAYKPLIYCWRGGERSSSLATVLARIGWRTTALKGGYKTYRNLVRRELEDLLPRFEYSIVSGATGSGKTRLLHTLAARGAQVLDLEALAGHRGSVLGGWGRQPSQRRFDSLLLSACDGFVPDTPVWVEAESSRIGDVYLPASLWKKMRSAGGIEVRMPFDARVNHLLTEYANLIASPPEFKEKLRLLIPRYGHRQFGVWCLLVDSGEWAGLAASLLAVHYDPAYAVSTARYYPHVTTTETLLDELPEALDCLAQKLYPSAREREGSMRQDHRCVSEPTA